MNEESQSKGHRRGLVVCLGITATLLVIFYVGVWISPGIIRALFSRSIYNYDLIAKKSLARGDYDAAVEVLERARSEVPRDIYYERPEYMDDWIGRIRRKQGRTTESLAAFLKAQKGYFRKIQLRGYLPPPRLIRDIVETYFETGNPAGAYNEARVAMDFYPTQMERYLDSHRKRAAGDPRILRDLGILQIKTRRRAEGRESLVKSLVRNSNLPQSHYCLGRLAEVQRRSDQAVLEYMKELENFPYNENAARRLARLSRQMGRDTSSVFDRAAKARSEPIAEFLAEDPGKPLFPFYGVGASGERDFKLTKPGKVLVNIDANSTPFDGIYGWIEILLDGRHVQTLYLDGDLLAKDRTQRQTYSVWLGALGAGPHRLRLVNLSDGRDKTSDRNSFIHAVRIYRVADE